MIVEFSDSMLMVSEDEKRLMVCLIKRGETTLQSSVSVTTCDRTVQGFQMARENKEPGPFSGDYASLQLMAIFEPDESESCVDVQITDDVVVEDVEIFGLCLDQIEETVIIGPVNTTTVTIVDDDSELLLSVVVVYLVICCF